jgi:hypothetical protein
MLGTLGTRSHEKKTNVIVSWVTIWLPFLTTLAIGECLTSTSSCEKTLSTANWKNIMESLLLSSEQPNGKMSLQQDTHQKKSQICNRQRARDALTDKDYCWCVWSQAGLLRRHYWPSCEVVSPRWTCAHGIWFSWRRGECAFSPCIEARALLEGQLLH